MHAINGNPRSKQIAAAKRSVWRPKEAKNVVEDKVIEEKLPPLDDEKLFIKESAYYVADHKECGDLTKEFPYLRFVHRVADANHVYYPIDLSLVLAYHVACYCLGLGADEGCETFCNNEFDRAQFTLEKEKLSLRPVENLKFFARKNGHTFKVGGISYDQTFNTSVLFDLSGVKAGYCVFVTQGVDDDVVRLSTREEEIDKRYDNLISEVKIFAASRQKTESLRSNLQSRFLWLCKANDLDPKEVMARFNSDLENIMHEYQYELIPFGVIDWMISKMPKGIMYDVVAGMLRLRNSKGELDQAFWEFSKEYIQADYSIDIAIYVDWFTNIMKGMGRLTVARDICGEQWCDKKRTYKIDIKDIRFERVGLCKDRDAYYKIGPSIPHFIPQVTSTCVHSTMNALETRFVSELSPDLPINYASYDQAHTLLRDELWRLFSRYNYDFKLMSFEEFVSSTTWPNGAKTIARGLINEIEGNELSWIDVQTRAFAKHEELKNKTAINTRFIQGFHVGMTMITGRIIKSLYKSLKPALGNPHEKICVGSMMYSEDIGEWNNFHKNQNQHCLDLDGEAYDSTTRRYRVDKIYQLYFELAGFAAEGIHTLQSGLKISGELFTHGIKYRLSNEHWKAGHAPMASGRADTTLTNTLLRLEEGLFYMEQTHVEGACIASGDDLSLLYTGEKITREKIAAAGLLLKRNEKFENDNHLYSVFLQKRFYPVGNLIVPAPKVGRVLSKLFWMDAKISASKRHRVLLGDLYGILATSSHVPILSDIAKRFITLIKGTAITNSIHNRKEWMEARCTYECDNETLLFFSEVYDITIDEIKQLQVRIATMDFDDEFDGPIFQKIFEADLPNAEPVRQGLISHFSPSFKINKFATIRNETFSFLAKVPEEISSIVIAPVVEEMWKLSFYMLFFILGNIVWPFGDIALALLTLIGPAGIAMWEAYMPGFGIHKIDFYTRLALHWFFTFGTRIIMMHCGYEPSIWLAILTHSIYNFCCYTGNMLYFLPTYQSGKMKLCSVIWYTVSGRQNFLGKIFHRAISFDDLGQPIDKTTKVREFVVKNILEPLRSFGMEIGMVENSYAGRLVFYFIGEDHFWSGNVTYLLSLLQ